MIIVSNDLETTYAKGTYNATCFVESNLTDELIATIYNSQALHLPSRPCPPFCLVLGDIDYDAAFQMPHFRQLCLTHRFVNVTIIMKQPKNLPTWWNYAAGIL